MKVVYVAGPYRGKNAWIVEQNIRKAELAAFRLAQLGFVALCPHSMERFFNGTLADEFWIESTLELLRRCDVVFLCEGWDKSEGSVGEHLEALRLGIPVYENMTELFRQEEIKG